MKRVGEEARNDGLDQFRSTCSTEKQDQEMCISRPESHMLYCYIQRILASIFMYCRTPVVTTKVTFNRVVNFFHLHFVKYKTYRKMFQLNIIIDFNEFPILCHILLSQKFYEVEAEIHVK
jgi:hypothetical protein